MAEASVNSNSDFLQLIPLLSCRKITIHHLQFTEILWRLLFNLCWCVSTLISQPQHGREGQKPSTHQAHWSRYRSHKGCCFGRSFSYLMLAGFFSSWMCSTFPLHFPPFLKAPAYIICFAWYKLLIFAYGACLVSFSLYAERCFGCQVAVLWAFSHYIQCFSRLT